MTDRVTAEHALADARDQAEAASRAKSRFLAMVSHEIRTPLNGILGMADLLGDTPLAPEQATYLKAMKTSGETLLSLIEEMLDFAKIEAGRLDLAVAAVRARRAWSRRRSNCSARARKAKGLEICCYVDERLPARVVGDAARLRQVLFNLAGNAIKFTEHGGVSIIVEPGAQDDGIAIAVRDTGIGISPEDQARIFLEFEQADGGSDAQIRRHRPRPDHFEAHRRAHGRRHRGREHAGQGLDLPRHARAAARRRRRRTAVCRARSCRQRYSHRRAGRDRSVADGAAAAALGRAHHDRSRRSRSRPRCCRSSRGAPCWSITRSARRPAKRWRAWRPRFRAASCWCTPADAQRARRAQGRRASPAI